MIPWLLADADGSRENLSIFDPVSPPAESIRNLSVLGLAITGFMFIGVEGILISSIVRFRHRRAAAPGIEATGLTLLALLASVVFLSRALKRLRFADAAERSGSRRSSP